MQHGELRPYRGSRLVNEFFLRFLSFNFNNTFKTGIVLHLLQARLLLHRQQHQVIVRLEKERIELKVILFPCPCQVSMLMIERCNPLSVDSGRASSDIPEWLQEFRENPVDDRVPERRDSHATSSHEVSLEPTSKRSADLGKHSVSIHFPKDRNCEICQRTKKTRAPCRRRIGGALLRAENVGDLITADHKVLSGGCESRHNHRFTVVVEDLTTQCVRSYPCKTKTYEETAKSLQKFLEPTRKPKVIYTDNFLEFGKYGE